MSSVARNRQSTRRRTRRSGGAWQTIKTILGVLTTIFLLLLLAGIGYGVYLIKSTAAALPASDSLVDYLPGGATEILATDKDPATGQNVVLGRVFTRYKEFAPITDMPQALQDATVAIEDERFYNHVGIDVRGTVRAMYRDVAGGHMSEGGSTLTQQLARNVVLFSQKKTFTRKLKEAIVAIELEKNFTKEQILEMYLNEVCYGNNTYGVKAAANAYFGKPLSKLTIAECALLAGLPQSPTGYDPFHHLEQATNRRNEVLRHMVEQHYITPAQCEEALREEPHLIALKERRQTEFKAPYFTTYVLRQVIARYGVDEVYKGGLRIYTTLNYKMQQEGERALINGVLDATADHVSDGALVSIEPHTGYIRSMVGGLDFKKNQYNNVTQGRRQPGSSFKAFVYTTAFMLQPKRFDPDSDVDDSPVTYKGNPPYSPRNFEGTFEGNVSIRRAFAKSINVVAVKVADAVGIRHVIETARAMGITAPLEPNLSLALGAYPVAPLEMASAYSIYPNHGNRAHPMAIIRIVDGDGKQLEFNTPQVDEGVIPEPVVAQMSSMMRDVVEHGTAAGAKGIHEVEDAHGKTGTTSESKDAWFIGYTPELTTAVWVGGAKRVVKDGKLIRTRYVPMSGITGGMVCAPIWARFMLKAIQIQRQSGEAIQAAPEKTDAVHHTKVHAPTPAPTDNPPGVPLADAAPTPVPSDPAGATPDDGVSSTPPAASPMPVATPTPDPGTTLADGESAVVKPATPTPHPSTLRNTSNSPRMVTVRICEDTGLVANSFCPTTVLRSFPANKAPHKVCTIHRAQPGDH